MKAPPIPNPELRNDSPSYLRGLIEDAGLAQAEVAQRIGVDARTFRRYLTGESGISYPVQFTVESLVYCIHHEWSTAQLKERSAGQLTYTLRQLRSELADLSVISHAHRRLAARIRAIERELKRKED
jgi:transcriptional regulator with XRE-family HTH domain